MQVRHIDFNYYIPSAKINFTLHGKKKNQVETSNLTSFISHKSIIYIFSQINLTILTLWLNSTKLVFCKCENVDIIKNRVI